VSSVATIGSSPEKAPKPADVPSAWLQPEREINNGETPTSAAQEVTTPEGHTVELIDPAAAVRVGDQAVPVDPISGQPLPTTTVTTGVQAISPEQPR
jgi:hypothetical protein